MKKIILALIMCVFFTPAFADSWDLGSGQTKEVYVSFSVFAGVLADGGFSSEAEESMLNTYQELAGIFGTKKLSVSDVLKICKSGGITTVSDCYTKILNPAITIMRAIRFENVCTGRVTGGVQHCVDDVFVKSYSMMVQKSGAGYNPYTDTAIGGDNYLTPGDIRIANNELAQDVRVSENMAFGFAWEYAKRDGNDVVCSPNIVDNFINCSTPDNKHFYTFKFFDTHNTSDSTIEENLIRGICAMYMSPFVDKGFKGVSGDGAMGLNINTNSEYGCEMDCASFDVRDVINKFGLFAENGYDIGNQDLGMYCKIKRLTGLSESSVAEYPGYEYMSYAFQEIQTILEPSLINVLKNYVSAQGIDVKSFDCNYGTSGYTGTTTVVGTGVPTSYGDMLRCRLNGREVDFVFDDLFESKRSARDIGKSGMRCLLMKREYTGGTASFDGKYCKGPTEDVCAELGKQISGGTHWDDGAGACVLNDAAAAKNLQTALTIAGGAAFTIGVTVLSGGSAAIVLLEVGSGVLFDLSFEGINRFYETRPNKLATEYIQTAQRCGLVGGDDARMCMNKQCIKDMVGKYIASIDGIIGDGMDALNDNQLQMFESVNERINNCLTDLDIQNAIKSSDVTSKDKFVSRASMALMVGGFFISPSNAVTKLKRLPKTAQILHRAGVKPIERVSSSLGNVRYHRIYVQDLNMNDIRKMTDELQTKGFYVSSNMDDTGKHFIGFSDEDIFGPWHNTKNNWLFGSSVESDLRVKASLNFDKHLDVFLRTGQSNGLPIERLTTDEWRRLNQELSGQGVELYQDVMNGKQVMRFRRIATNGINLRTKASQNFDKYLSAALDSNPTFYSLPKERLSDIEWQQLNNELKKQGIQLVETYRGDELYMTFKRIDSNGNNSWVFSRVYNDMPDEMLNAKLKYIYENSHDIASAVRALKASDVYDAAKTATLAQDLANETVRRIQNFDSSIINRMKRYKYMTNEEKMMLAGDLHEIITTERRQHVGNTVIGYDFDTEWSWKGGSGTQGDGFRFSYGLKGDSVEGLISVIFHENTHALQTLGKSALPKPVAEWNMRYYADKDRFGQMYYDNVIEIEAYQIGMEAARRVVKALGI